MLFPLCFYFSFLPVHAFDLCLFIFLGEANLPVFLTMQCLSLAFKSQPTPLFLEVSPQGVGLCCKGSPEMAHLESGRPVSWAETECHSPEFCPVNLSNLPFQLL